MDNGHGEAPSPPGVQFTPPASACRRLTRLISLVTALVLFSIWLPTRARVALLMALRAQLALVSMLLLFAMITLSVVWSAGQRLDTRAFLLFNLRWFRTKNSKAETNAAPMLPSCVARNMMRSSQSGW